MAGIKTYYHLIREAAREFAADNVIKLSASLAYYTIFSIGPLLLVIISFTGLFFERQQISGKLHLQIQELVGTEGASQVFSIIESLQEQQSAQTFSIVGIIILIFGATGVFADIQDSINYIWSIRAKPSRSWLKFLKDRLLSFSLVVGIGFLLIVSLLANTLSDLLTDRLQEFFLTQVVIVFKILNIVILFLITSFLFAVIYKVLPDARISWKDAMAGATFTSLLFMLGRFLIGLYLSGSGVATTYGAAAAIIIVLSWVYYSSIILYFGAEFTKVYAIRAGKGIRPYSTAVFIVKQEARELPHVKEVKKSGPADAVSGD